MNIRIYLILSILIISICLVSILFSKSQLYLYSPRSISDYKKLISNSKSSYCFMDGSSTIIFIHLGNKSDQWTDLEMCAIKSASVMNPANGVCVLTQFTMKEHPALVSLPNLEFTQFDVGTMFDNTPLQDWWYKISSNNSQKGTFYQYHLSDALRYVYLYKYGGKYLDTDCLTLRNLYSLRNVTGYEKVGRIANGVLIFDKGHLFVKEILEKFAKNFSPNVWGSGGPSLVTSVHSSGRVDNSTYTVLDPNAFYPIHFLKFQLPFSPEHLNETERAVENSYTLHLWRKWMMWQKKDNIYKSPPDGSFVYQFMKEVCFSGKIIHD